MITKSNSYIYEFSKFIEGKEVCLYNSDVKSIVLLINNKYCLFNTNTIDFSDEEIKNTYNNQQIYINIRNWKVSHDFLNDYRKLIKKSGYFEIDKNNLFKVSEKKIRKILENIFIWKCLDVWCWDSLYKEIFTKKEVDYLWIDIHKVDNWLKIIETTFEDFNTNNKYDLIFFFRSINHFVNTQEIINKAYLLLNNWWKIFIVENEIFWEVKFRNQIFEWKKDDFEHFYNYSLEDFKRLVNLDKFNILEEEWVDKYSANQWYILLEKK